MAVPTEHQVFTPKIDSRGTRINRQITNWDRFEEEVTSRQTSIENKMLKKEQVQEKKDREARKTEKERQEKIQS